MSEFVTYVIQAGWGEYGPVKIGKTRRSVRKRIEQLQPGCPEKLYEVREFDGDVEAVLHERFARYRLRGEWFSHHVFYELGSSPYRND